MIGLYGAISVQRAADMMKHMDDGSESPVADSLQCVCCGYNLRGLGEAADCPECGTPKRHSRHDLLQYADPQWLATIVRGMNIANVARYAVISLVITYLSFLAIGVVLSKLERVPIATITNAVMTVILFGFLLAFLAIGFGLWLLSEPEPRGTSQAAVWYRILSVALVPIMGLWMFITATQSLNALHWSVQQAAVHLCFGLVVAHGVLMSHQANELEKRLPSEGDLSPRRASRFQARVSVVGIIFGLALYWLLPAMFSLLPGWQPPGESAQMWLLLLTCLVWFALFSHLVSFKQRIIEQCSATRVEH